MNINIVLKSVDVTINKFKTVFPELVDYANIERYKAETIEAIFAYEKKATLLKKDLLLDELKKYFNTGREIFEEGFNKGNNKDRADNILVGMLEMNWIESFLTEINKPKELAIEQCSHKPKDMKQIFNLDNANNAYAYEPSDKLICMVDKLKEILSLKEKLQFYNDNIFSFSYSFPDGEICEYGFKRWRGCGDVLFKLIPGTEIFSLFLEIRANEIQRLKKLVDSKEKTIDKIRVLFEDRAGNPDIDNEFFKIETNEFVTFIRNGAGVLPDGLEHYVLNLSYLSKSEDKKYYNEYLYNYYSHIFNNPESQPLINKLENFGFKYEIAISQFKLQLENSLDFDKTLNAEIKRIDNHFPLNDFNNIIYSYYDYNRSEKWKCALFNAFANGVKFDFGIIKLEAEQVRDFIHIEQVFSYYKELIKMKKDGKFGAVLPQKQQTPELKKTDLNLKISNLGDVREHITQTFHEVDKGFLKELHLPDFYDNVQIISKLFDVEYLTKNIDTNKWKIYLQSLRNDIEKYKSCDNEMLQMLHSHIYLQLDTIESGISNIENLESKSKATEKQPKKNVDNLIKTITENQFSVLEWATVFYYADETKLTSSGKTLKSRMIDFMEKHNIETTISHFKNNFYDAKKRINDKSDYPIDKLELIIPFLKKNYQLTVTKVENDITFLEENESDY